MTSTMISEHPAGDGLTIRPGGPVDAPAIDRLGELDERDPGAGPHLVATEQGAVLAALSLADGTAVADPFRRTGDVVELLRVRAAQLSAHRDPKRGRRLRGGRTFAVLGAAIAAAAAFAAAASAAWTVGISGAPVAINPTSKAFAISVACNSESEPCKGVLDVRTAARIKPYTSQPAAVAKVGTFPFSIPADTTAKVKGRVYGPALAQATKAGRVLLTVKAAAVGVATPLGSKDVLFTIKRS